MNYVCTVVGRLVFDDINLELNYMEIIDLSPADFKVSPRIRDAYRSKQIVPYDPRVHPNAKRFNRFTKDTKLSSVQQSENTFTDTSNKDVRFSEVAVLKQSLEAISDKMNGLVNRLDVFINKQSESNERLNTNLEKLFNNSSKSSVAPEVFEKFVDNSMAYHSKMEEIWEKRLNDKEDKISALISKLDEFMEKGIRVSGATTANSIVGGLNTKRDTFDDKVTFIPQIEVSGLKTSIKTQDIQQEGTDDVLAQLRSMKK